MFFKHNHLTNTTLMNFNAITQAAKDLAKAIEDNIPQTDESKKAINQFMELIKMKSKQYEEPVIQKRVLENHLPPQRVRKEPDPVPA